MRGAMMVRRGLWPRVVLAAAGTIVATLGAPGLASAASAPSCGDVNGLPHHCYVQAVFGYPGGQPDISSLTGYFTVPSKLAVKSPAYSIAQFALEYGSSDIELGWLVSPANYHNDYPHLFVFFRRPSGGPCEEGIPRETKVPYCPSNDYINLQSKYFPGMTMPGKPAFFAVGYNSQTNYWYIQYQDQYFGKMNGNWWSGGNPLFTFSGGDTAFWYGEVYFPKASYVCTPMGNGRYGSLAKAATISDMRYGTGGSLSQAPADISEITYPKYWDSNAKVGQQVTSFSFGGPRGGANGC